jgi:hypothetical protein
LSPWTRGAAKEFQGIPAQAHLESVNETGF